MGAKKWEELVALTAKKAAKTLSDPVIAEAAKVELATAIEREIYTVYEPLEYIRRGFRDSPEAIDALSNEENIALTVKNISNGAELTVTSTAPPEGGRTSSGFDDELIYWYENGFARSPVSHRPAVSSAQEAMNRKGSRTQNAVRDAIKREFNS